MWERAPSPVQRAKRALEVFIVYPILSSNYKLPDFRNMPPSMKWVLPVT
jgi:hypothetical protein